MIAYTFDPRYKMRQASYYKYTDGKTDVTYHFEDDK